MAGQSSDGFLWPAHLMTEIRKIGDEWRRFHDLMTSTTSPVLAEVERASRNTAIPAALRSVPNTAHVTRDLVPLVRAAATAVPLPPLVPPIDPYLIHRPHQRGERCWCHPWLIGSTVMHRDGNVPVSSYGYVLPNSMLAERHAVGCICVTCGPGPAGTCSY